MNASQPNFCRGSQSAAGYARGKIKPATARCPQCGRGIALTAAGKLRNHSRKGVA